MLKFYDLDITALPLFNELCKYSELTDAWNGTERYSSQPLCSIRMICTKLFKIDLDDQALQVDTPLSY